MTQRDELDLILTLIRKYNLPLSPILEYAVKEKKEEYLDEIVKTSAPMAEEAIVENVSDSDSFIEELPSIELTREIIEGARTPNGGFTKSQLAAIGIAWPPPQDWIEDKVGTYVTTHQLEEFNRIEYVTKRRSKSVSSHLSQEARSYKNIASGNVDMRRLEAVLSAIAHFDVPATPHDVARTVNRNVWGGDGVDDESIDSLLKRLPEVEYVPWGKYILKDKKKD